VLYRRAADCPDAAKLHTPCPDGYAAWFEWAEKKQVTHDQVTCPTCGFYAVWIRKKGRHGD
jgi:hypothetical protein